MIKKTFILRLKGGLGNQMFQYAAARAISARNKSTLLLDPHTFYESDRFHRKYELGCFNISAPLLTRSEAEAALGKRHLRRNVALLIEQFAMRRLNLFFVPWLNSLFHQSDSCAENYFQSYLYFHESRQFTQREFTFPKNATVKRELARQIAESESIAVHVRFGHGLSAEGCVVSSQAAVKPTHDVMRKFYGKALSLVLRKTKRPHFFIFYDIDGGYEVCPQGSRVTAVRSNPSEPPWYDMWLMSLCKHNVIANSTFSWWAAWLNRNPDKQIYAPANFLSVYSRRQSKYIYPPSWTIL